MNELRLLNYCHFSDLTEVNFHGSSLRMFLNVNLLNPLSLPNNDVREQEVLSHCQYLSTL